MIYGIFGVLLIIIPILPSLLLLPLYHSFNPTGFFPPQSLRRALIIGLLAPFFIFIPQWLLFDILKWVSENYRTLAETFIAIALPEEIIRLIGIRMLKRTIVRKDLDIVFLAFYLAAGLSLTENVFYVLSSDYPLHTAMLRGITALPLHSLNSGIIGMGLYMDWNPDSSRNFTLLSLLIALAVHGLYDLILTYSSIHDFLIIPLLSAGWFGLIYTMKRVQKKNL